MQKDFYQDKEKSILLQIDELQKDLEAVRRLKIRYPNEPDTLSKKHDIIFKEVGQAIDEHQKVVFQKTPLVIPDEYNKDLLTWEQRCVYILNELGKATVEDVINKLKVYEPDVSDTTAKNVVTNKLSKLNRTGRIKADKTGKKYIYYM